MKNLLIISCTFALSICIVIDQNKYLLINIDKFVVPELKLYNLYFKDDRKGLYILNNILL